MALDTLTWTWEVEAGEDETITVPIVQAGSPVDIAGRTVDVRVRPRPGARTALHVFTPDQIEIVRVELEDPARDGVRLTVPAVLSASWTTWSTAWWRMVITTAGADPTAERVIQGPLLVHPD